MRQPRAAVIPIMLALCAPWCGPAFGKPKVVQVKVRTDSEAAGYEATRAMDGNPQTMWHTYFGAGETRQAARIYKHLRDTRTGADERYIRQAAEQALAQA